MTADPATSASPWLQASPASQVLPAERAMSKPQDDKALVAGEEAGGGGGVSLGKGAWDCDTNTGAGRRAPGSD